MWSIAMLEETLQLNFDPFDSERRFTLSIMSQAQNRHKVASCWNSCMLLSVAFIAMNSCTLHHTLQHTTMWQILTKQWREDKFEDKGGLSPTGNAMDQFGIRKSNGQQWTIRNKAMNGMQVGTSLVQDVVGSSELAKLQLGAEQVGVCSLKMFEVHFAFHFAELRTCSSLCSMNFCDFVPFSALIISCPLSHCVNRSADWKNQRRSWPGQQLWHGICSNM